MIRRAFVRALSGAILTTLLGVKAWRLEDAEGWTHHTPGFVFDEFDDLGFAYGTHEAEWHGYRFANGAVYEVRGRVLGNNPFTLTESIRRISEPQP